MYLRKGKIFSTLVMLTLVIAVVTNVFVITPMIVCADPGDQPDSYWNKTTLNVTVLQLQPRINWYDFQYNNSGTWVSRRNQQIDVNNSAEYRFIVNISSDQKWVDIEFINVTAWYDNGSEANGYSSTLGGNINLELQYENTSATGDIGVFRMLWPDDEVTFNPEDSNETNKTGTDPQGSPGNTETYNLTFAFTPGYQFRYAPDPSDPVAGHNDIWSWNFNITAEDQAGNKSYNNPTIGETIDEFGVYSYTEIMSAGWPTITGNPGDDPAYNDSYIPIEHRSNGNYSLEVNVTNLTHKQTQSYWIDNSSIWTAGGELSPLTKFSGTGPHYYYNGSGAGYTDAENDDTSKTTSDIEWAVTIAIGQQPGDYNATIYYHLRTETS